MSSQLTKFEIINETLAFYSEDVNRRAIKKTGNYCEYLTEDGKKCAVGRCMTSEALNEYGDYMGTIDSLIIEDPKQINLDDLLEEKYRGHEEEFWSNLQRIHDKPENWNEAGLTFEGMNNVEKIKEMYKED